MRALLPLLAALAAAPASAGDTTCVPGATVLASDDGAALVRSGDDIFGCAAGGAPRRLFTLDTVHDQLGPAAVGRGYGAVTIFSTDDEGEELTEVTSYRLRDGKRAQDILDRFDADPAAVVIGPGGLIATRYLSEHGISGIDAFPADHAIWTVRETAHAIDGVRWVSARRLAWTEDGVAQSTRLPKLRARIEVRAHGIRTVRGTHGDFNRPLRVHSPIVVTVRPSGRGVRLSSRAEWFGQPGSGNPPGCRDRLERGASSTGRVRIALRPGHRGWCRDNDYDLNVIRFYGRWNHPCREVAAPCFAWVDNGFFVTFHSAHPRGRG